MDSDDEFKGKDTGFEVPETRLSGHAGHAPGPVLSMAAEDRASTSTPSQMVCLRSKQAALQPRT